MKRLLLAFGFLATFLLAEQKPCPFPSPWSPWQWLARLEGDFQCNSSRKPQWWAKTIQPFWISPHTFQNTVFFQFSSMFNSNRFTLSPGAGYRYMPPERNYLLGLNFFYDIRYADPLQRISIGADIQTRWLTISGNCYLRVNGQWKSIHVRDGVTTAEKTLNGGDANLTFPFPYLPWFRLGGGYYHWESLNVQRINGYKLYAELNLVGPLAVEGGMERDNLRHNNYLFISLNLGSPNYRQFTFWKNLATRDPFPARDLRRFVLTPVMREARVVNESRQTGSSGIVIGRGT